MKLGEVVVYICATTSPCFIIGLESTIFDNNRQKLIIACIRLEKND